MNNTESKKEPKSNFLVRKSRQVNIAMRNIWWWLKYLREYQHDYKIQQSLLRKRIIYPLAYSQKCKRRKHHLNKKIIKETEKTRAYLLKKWGFCPLVNPKIKRLPKENLEPLLKKFTGFDYKVAEIKNISQADWDCMFLYAIYRLVGRQKGMPKKILLPKLPERLLIAVDYKRTDAEIISRIVHELSIIRDIYRLKPKRPQIELFEIQYKAHVLKQLGANRKQIKDHLFSNIEDKDASEKRTTRIMKKISAIMDK